MLGLIGGSEDMAKAVRVGSKVHSLFGKYTRCGFILTYAETSDDYMDITCKSCRKSILADLRRDIIDRHSALDRLKKRRADLIRKYHNG